MTEKQQWSNVNETKKVQKRQELLRLNGNEVELCTLTEERDLV